MNLTAMKLAPAPKPVRGVRATARALTLALAAVAAAPQAHALFGDDEARKAILELRQKVDANARAAAEALAAAQAAHAAELTRQREENAQLRRSLLELQNQIEALRGEIARLRGQDEMLAREVAELQRRQKDVQQSVDERMRRFEPQKVSVEGREFTADPAEVREFDAALGQFRKGEMASAQTAFGDFVRRWPQSGYKPTALFWLGNAQYVAREYREAVASLRAMLAQAPDHPRAPEAMLAIANCQVELKDARAARKTLEDLIKAWPQSEAAVAARDRLARLR